MTGVYTKFKLEFTTIGTNRERTTSDNMTIIEEYSQKLNIT